MNDTATKATAIRAEIEFSKERAAGNLRIGAAMAACGWLRRVKRLELELSELAH